MLRRENLLESATRIISREMVSMARLTMVSSRLPPLTPKSMSQPAPLKNILSALTPDGAADDEQLHAGCVKQLRGDVHSVGDDLQPLPVLDLPGDLKRSRSGIKNDRLAVVDQRSGHGADAPLLRRVRLETLVHRRFAMDRVGKDRSAVGAQHQSSLMQLIQIAANGNGGGAELGGKFIDFDAARAAHLLKNLCAPLLGHHRVRQEIAGLRNGCRVGSRSGGTSPWIGVCHLAIYKCNA